jgi:DNA-binding MarR family transcriptional regulator/GNAT superfamily N-acetyltransferase
MGSETDFIEDLGLLAFVTRLKRLSDAMLHDGRRLYRDLGIDIEPNWYVVFKLLEHQGPYTVTQIADKIGFAHPSVIPIVNRMIKAGYLEEIRDVADGRKRFLKLTPKATEKLPEFDRVWRAGTAGIKRMLSDIDALEFLRILEERVASRGFRARTLDELANQKPSVIRQFTPDLASEFARLNYDWIREYFEIEAPDREALEHPLESVIDPGGMIFFAIVEETVAGTVALIEEGDAFELAKMAVAREFRGAGIGDRLMKACIEYAERAGKTRLFLLSNTKLIPAIRLYRKFGFREIPLDPGVPYVRTNIAMELTLGERR